jgi:hypothetical protein
MIQINVLLLDTINLIVKIAFKIHLVHAMIVRLKCAIHL